jgi:hypothetical protein
MTSKNPKLLLKLMSKDQIKPITMENFTKLILLSILALFSSGVCANHLSGKILFSNRFAG